MMSTVPVQKPIALITAMLSGGVLGVAGEAAALDGPKVIGVAIFIGTGCVLILWKVVSWWLDGVSRTWNSIPGQFETLDGKLDALASQLAMHMALQAEVRKAREVRDGEIDRRLTAIEQRCLAFPPNHAVGS